MIQVLTPFLLWQTVHPLINCLVALMHSRSYEIKRASITERGSPCCGTSDPFHRVSYTQSWFLMGRSHRDILRWEKFMIHDVMCALVTGSGSRLNMDQGL